MTKGVPTTKSLVAVPNLSGLADRITGLVTVFLMSMLTKRTFMVGKRPELLDLELVFDSPNINWSRPPDPLWLFEPLQYKAAKRNYNSSVLAAKEYYALNTIDDYRLQDKLIRQNLNDLLGGSSKTTLIAINRGKTIRMWENPHHRDQLAKWGLNSYNTFGCLTNYLLKPKEEIFAPVHKIASKMLDPNPSILKIAIQIRVGDWALAKESHSINIHQYRGYFHCAEQIEAFAKQKKEYSEVIWYLASDSLPLREAAVKHYGIKVLTQTNGTLEHSAKESSVCAVGNNCAVSEVGFRMAAAEWWLLGLANYYVITRYSGYGRTAGFRSLNKDSIYTIHNSKALITCSNTTFSDLETMSFDWAGI